MLWLALVLFLALVIAILRGGRLTNLGDIELRSWWLLIVGFGLQAATRLLPQKDWAETAGILMVLGSFLLLMVLVIVNRNNPGMWLAGVGVLMNFTVISLNGGMPVLTEAAVVASGFTVSDPDIAGSFKHVVLGADTLLPTFGDLIPLRLAGHGQVISLGDVFLAVGLGRFLEHELRKPRRYFKKGASAEAGSAH
ncbi:MAG: DUF5317 domain-containing protein [Acidimicrobiia bacterium]